MVKIHVDELIENRITLNVPYEGGALLGVAGGPQLDWGIPRRPRDELTQGLAIDLEGHGLNASSVKVSRRDPGPSQKATLLTEDGAGPHV